MIDHNKALILDMDGVLWRENAPIGNLPSIFARIHERGLKVALATNNATKTVDEYLERFAGFGVTLEAWQVITSAVAAADLLSKRFPQGGAVFIVGENGIQRALEERGFQPIIDPANETPPVAVVSSFDRGVTYQKLRRATLHIRAGAILASIEAATDVKPIVIGKPSPTMMYMALEKLGTKPGETLVVGDRLETDIAAGQAAGCKTALVLSGVSTKEQAEKWQPAPDLVVEDLASLVK